MPIYKDIETIADMVIKASGGHGARPDGSAKGEGFLGRLSGRNGFSTELSASADVDGKRLDYPLITPNQSFADLSSMVMGGEPSDAAHKAAIDHAMTRKVTGRSPFAGIGEQRPYTKDK